MAKNIKPASEYAKPHTMSGGSISMKDAVVKKGNPMDELKISVGGISKGELGEKTDGIKIRGTGAATKGVMARGPMA